MLLVCSYHFFDVDYLLERKVLIRLHTLCQLECHNVWADETNGGINAYCHKEVKVDLLSHADMIGRES